MVFTPAVTAPNIVFHTSHPPPSKLWHGQKTDYEMKTSLSPLTSMLHPIQSAMVTQFPDPRLIQYDCGELTVFRSKLLVNWFFMRKRSVFSFGYWRVHLCKCARRMYPGTYQLGTFDSNRVIPSRYYLQIIFSIQELFNLYYYLIVLVI